MLSIMQVVLSKSQAPRSGRAAHPDAAALRSQYLLIQRQVRSFGRCTTPPRHRYGASRPIQYISNVKCGFEQDSKGAHHRRGTDVQSGVRQQASQSHQPQSVVQSEKGRSQVPKNTENRHGTIVRAPIM
jgi:hypothetical protein